MHRYNEEPVERGEGGAAGEPAGVERVLERGQGGARRGQGKPGRAQRAKTSGAGGDGGQHQERDFHRGLLAG
jgi:hypothetical protein